MPVSKRIIKNGQRSARPLVLSTFSGGDFRSAQLQVDVAPNVMTRADRIRQAFGVFLWRYCPVEFDSQTDSVLTVWVPDRGEELQARMFAFHEDGQADDRPFLPTSANELHGFELPDSREIRSAVFEEINQRILGAQQ